MLLNKMRALVRGEISRRMQDVNQLANSLQYSDEEIDTIINQAIKEFCTDVHLVFDDESIAITDGVGSTTLDILEILRAEFDGDPISSVNERTLPDGVPV